MRASLLMCCLWLLTGAAHAQAPIVVLVDGHPVPLDVAPRIVHRRVLVPMRGIFERAGAHVGWHASTHVVVVRQGPALLTVGVEAPVAYLNGRQLHLDVPPQLVAGRVFVPLRFVSEALGSTVRWSPWTRTVAIVTPARPASGEQLSPVAVAPAPVPAVEDPYVVARWTVLPPVAMPGENATVQVWGVPDSTGEMIYAGRHAPLVQVGPGYYEGTQVVAAGDVVRDRRTTVVVTTPDGVRTVQQTTRPLLMQGPFVAGQPILSRISINSADPLHTGQRLVVAAEGTPGMQASFSLGAYVFPMPEGRPGQYRGEYVVQPGDRATNAAVKVSLAGNNLQTTAEVSQPANLISP